MAVSIVPPGLLKICEMLGFVADREVGLKSLEMCSKSDDMKAPVARYTDFVTYFSYGCRRNCAQNFQTESHLGRFAESRLEKR